MRGGDRRAGGGPAGLQSHQGHPAGNGPLGHLGELLGVAHGLQEQADGGDPVVVQQGRHGIVGAEGRLVADRDHRAEAQAALLERQVDGDVAALGDDGHAAVVQAATVLVRPQRHPVEGVDEAVAVGPEERHVAGGLQEVRLQCRLTGLGEAGAVADGAAGTHRPQLVHGGDGGMAVDAEEGGVGHPRQVLHRGHARHTGDVLPRRVDGPQLAREAELAALLDHPDGRLAAEHRHGARRQEAGEVGHLRRRTGAAWRGR